MATISEPLSGAMHQTLTSGRRSRASGASGPIATPSCERPLRPTSRGWRCSRSAGSASTFARTPDLVAQAADAALVERPFDVELERPTRRRIVADSSADPAVEIVRGDRRRAAGDVELL